MKHDFHKCHELECFVCDGGLALCNICGGAEGDLPSECPGYRMSEAEREDIMADRADFINGKWQRK